MNDRLVNCLALPDMLFDTASVEEENKVRVYAWIPISLDWKNPYFKSIH